MSGGNPNEEVKDNGQQGTANQDVTNMLYKEGLIWYHENKRRI